MDFGTSLALAFVIIGIILIIVEAASPGTFIIVPATVILALGLIGLVYPDFLTSWWSPVVALAVLIPVTYATVKVYSRIAPPAPPETTISTSLIGKTGRVTAPIDPNTLKGKVRIGNDSWSATSSEPIPVDVMVKVVGSEGVHVKVERLKNTET